MKFIKTVPLFILLAICVIISFACSNGKSPVVPSNDDISSISNNLPDTFGTQSENHTILAGYDVVIDPDAETFTMTPFERSSQYHYPLTSMYPNVLQITGFGFSPNLWADIKLTHPYPGSGIDGFDARVIALLPANPGVSMNYPISDVQANNSVILESDGYTKLFDNLGGSIAGNTNPFKAYFKDEPNRVWSGTGATEETQRWQMDIAGFAGPLQYKLIVDVSTNFPNPPQPIIDNAHEPVQIETYIGRDLSTYGGGSLIEVTLLDWQGEENIMCKVESPQLFDGTVDLFYSQPGINPNEYIFSGNILNSLLAPVGNYNLLISVLDIPTAVWMFSEVEVSVSVITDGSLVWAKQSEGSSSNKKSRAITTLSDNSAVITGNFEGTAIFGSGEINETVLISIDNSDFFIARYNQDGTLEWAKRAGGTSYEYGIGITTLSDDSTVVTGYFRESVIFGLGELNETEIFSAGSQDIFIAQYNPDGTLEWAKSAGGALYDYGYGITTLSDNSTVVTGNFEGSITFGLGEPNETTLASVGDDDIFVAHYNSDGTLAWAKFAGGYEDDYGFSITSLSDDSTVVTGNYRNAAIFGLGEPNETLLTAAGSKDVFVARYNSDGFLLWVKSAGGDRSWDIGRGITTLSDDSTVVTGYFRVSSTFGLGEPNETFLKSGGNNDIFVARYNPDGTLEWAKRAGGGGDHYSRGITALSDNSTVVTGYFKGETIFGLGEPNETVLTNIGNNDIFVARYNPDGTLAWAKIAGGTSYEVGYGITSLSNDSTVVTGTFLETVIFGKNEPNQTTLISTDSSEIFIARFEP